MIRKRLGAPGSLETNFQVVNNLLRSYDPDDVVTAIEMFCEKWGLLMLYMFPSQSLFYSFLHIFKFSYSRRPRGGIYKLVPSLVTGVFRAVVL